MATAGCEAFQSHSWGWQATRVHVHDDDVGSREKCSSALVLPWGVCSWHDHEYSWADFDVGCEADGMVGPPGDAWACRAFNENRHTEVGLVVANAKGQAMQARDLSVSSSVVALHVFVVASLMCVS